MRGYHQLLLIPCARRSPTRSAAWWSIGCLACCGRVHIHRTSREMSFSGFQGYLQEKVSDYCHAGLRDPGGYSRFSGGPAFQRVVFLQPLSAATVSSEYLLPFGGDVDARFRLEGCEVVEVKTMLVSWFLLLGRAVEDVKSKRRSMGPLPLKGAGEIQTV